MFAVPLLIFAANVAGCVWIARTRRRWVAYVFALLPIGFVFALLLKARCPACFEYYYPGAKVCPHCGRNIQGGDVTVSDPARTPGKYSRR